MAAVLVKSLINSNKVVIFSKTTCPYCTMAKKVFDALKQQFTLVELDERSDGAEIQAVLGSMTGASSVPRVFVKGQFIGGGTDCEGLYKSGQLQRLLA